MTPEIAEALVGLIGEVTSLVDFAPVFLVLWLGVKFWKEF